MTHDELTLKAIATFNGAYADGLTTALNAVVAMVLEEAARVMDEMGQLEEKDYGLTRGAQNYYRSRNAIRALQGNPQAQMRSLDNPEG